MISLEIVVAMNQAAVIGNAGTLPWDHPADLRHFRELTSTCPVIVGRATMDDIVARAQAAGRRVLPTRQPVVVSRRPYGDYPTAPTVAEAMALAGPLGTGQVMVIGGGGRVYREALQLPELTTIHLTLVPGFHSGDTHMPDGWLAGWTSVERKEGPNGLVFTTWHRDDRVAHARQAAANKFCFCAGSGWKPSTEDECRQQADRVIGGPLRARIAMLEAEREAIRTGKVFGPGDPWPDVSPGAVAAVHFGDYRRQELWVASGANIGNWYPLGGEFGSPNVAEDPATTSPRQPARTTGGGQPAPSRCTRNGRTSSPAAQSPCSCPVTPACTRPAGRTGAGDCWSRSRTYATRRTPQRAATAMAEPTSVDLDGLTADQCEEIFHAVLRTGDPRGVEAALTLLAVRDPYRAELLLEATRTALVIAAQVPR